MALENMQFLARVDAPDDDGGVGAAGDEYVDGLTLGGIRGSVRGGIRSGVRGGVLSLGGRPPDARADETLHEVGVGKVLAARLAGRDVPAPNCLVPTAGEEGRARGGDSEAGKGCRGAAEDVRSVAGLGAVSGVCCEAFVPSRLRGEFGQAVHNGCSRSCLAPRRKTRSRVEDMRVF